MANRRFGWHSGALHCKSIEIGSPSIALGATDQVGTGIQLNTNGAGRTWAAGIFANITQGTTKNVTGYLTAAEFEVKLSAVTNMSEWAVMTLNSWDNNAVGSFRTYIWLRDYGSMKMNSLLRFSDAAIGLDGDVVSLIAVTNSAAATHTIRMTIGSTPYWILVSSAQT
jgi:hypothetical protein